MIKAVRYFSFSLIDSQSADAFVSRSRMNSALAFELTDTQIEQQEVGNDAEDNTWISTATPGVGPLTEKELNRTFEGVTKGDWVKAEILPTVYRRDTQFRHSAKTHRWAPEYINPISFKVYIHRSGRMVSHSRPRIARECLEPAGQGGIILGTMDDLDTFFENNPYPEYNHPGQEEPESRLSIQETLDYCDKLFSEVCMGSLEEPHPGLHYHRLDRPLIAMKTEQDASVKPLLAVYDALETLNADAPCLSNFVAPLHSVNTSHTRPAQSVPKMGVQWGTLQPGVTLSEDQKTAINASVTMRAGEVLAINGPPGTGKTAILKDLVASHVVRAVLADKNPPLTGISSTNNQAIRNAMLSLTEYVDSDSVLNKRWIAEAPGMAVYAVSKHGEALAETNNLFTMNQLDELESNIDILQACVRFCRLANDALKPAEPITSIEDARKAVLVKLKKEARIQAWTTKAPTTLAGIKNEKGFQRFIRELHHYKSVWLGHHTVNHSLVHAWTALEAQIEDAETAFDYVRDIVPDSQKHISIIEQAEKNHPLMKRIPWLASTKWAKGIVKPAVREALLAAGLNPLHTTTAAAKKHYKTQRKERLRSAIQVLRGIAKGETLAEWSRQTELDLSKSWRGNWFWYAMHVREAEWLIELRDTIRSSDPDKRTHDKVVRRLKRQAMICPVLVSTLHRLPKVLSHWDIRRQSELPLFNIMDNLIIDEAGQCSPDIAAPAIALTKKAILIGDRFQIEPVWSVSEREDIGNRIASGLLTKPESSGYKGEQFNVCGGATSGGSALWLAQKTTCTSDQSTGMPGLNLLVNRRSVAPILELSNTLCYDGQLSPGRLDRPASPFPAIGLMDIPGQCAEQMGSRMNVMEATAISSWIASEKDRIEEAYGKPVGECVGVVTPFKAQASYLQSRVDRQLGKDQGVTIGTIHSLQGAERPIIIMSLTYSADDHPQRMFFDQTPTMLNVAASRAKDSFIVAGDLDTLARAQNSAKVMATHLQDNGSPVTWAPWHGDMANHAVSVWGKDATATMIEGQRSENALEMALSDETIESIVISITSLSSEPLKNLGNKMIKAARRNCKVTLVISQSVALKHPEAERIGRGFDALQSNGVSIRYTTTTLSNRVVMSNGMTLITPTSWFMETPPDQILLIQNDQGREMKRMESAYNLDGAFS